jgi:hypothetical protein
VREREALAQFRRNVERDDDRIARITPHGRHGQRMETALNDT